METPSKGEAFSAGIKQVSDEDLFDSKYSHSFSDATSPAPNLGVTSPVKLDYVGMEKVDEEDEESEDPNSKVAKTRGSINQKVMNKEITVEEVGQQHQETLEMMQVKGTSSAGVEQPAESDNQASLPKQLAESKKSKVTKKNSSLSQNSKKSSKKRSSVTRSKKSELDVDS